MDPFLHPLLYVKASPVHGWGVFTRAEISRGLVIECSPILTLPSEPQGLFFEYRFGWPQNKPWTEMVLGLGYSSLYNHSSSPNVKWESDEENRLLVFITTRDVEAGEELFTYYGDDYNWESVGYIDKNSHGKSNPTVEPQIISEEEEKRNSRQDQIFEI